MGPRGAGGSPERSRDLRKGAIIKVLWHSNAPFAPTGYGVQTGLFAPRLKQAGYELIVSAFYGLQGAPISWKGVTVAPGNCGTYGNETLPGHVMAHFREQRGGLVLTLMDVWVLDAPTMAKFNTASWCPVDHDPITPQVYDYFKDSGAIPIAMSRFGEEQLADFDPLYVPHGVDTSDFVPIPKAKAREVAGLPESAFVVGMVAANQGRPSRKCFPQALKAFKAIKERHDDALLCLHTEITGGPGTGVNIGTLIEQLGLLGSVHIVDQYGYQYVPLKPHEMAASYSSLDVLLNPSAGEGFGVPILEAQACGVPAVVTDHSAMPEVCGAGWKVGYTPFYTAGNSYQADPDVEEIVESLEACYGLSEGQRRAIGEQARNHALGYDVETVMSDFMLPALDEIVERYGLEGLEARDEIEVAA